MSELVEMDAIRDRIEAFIQAHQDLTDGECNRSFSALPRLYSKLAGGFDAVGGSDAHL